MKNFDNRNYYKFASILSDRNYKYILEKLYIHRARKLMEEFPRWQKMEICVFM